MNPVEVDDNIFLMDVYEQNQPFRSGAYCVRGDEPAVIETGAQTGHRHLIRSLRQWGVTPDDPLHVIVTHVHLDHAGGAGQLMRVFPRAVLHCHPRGCIHLADPSRLLRGARAVYGERMDTMFGPVTGISDARIRVEEDGATLELGGRRLTFYHTPGHAKHHFCVVDSQSGGLFGGDAVGVRYDPRYTGWDFVYGLPTTSPADFNPGVMLKTLDRLEQLECRTVFHTHYGLSRPADAFAFTRRGVRGFMDWMEAFGPDSAQEAIAERMRRYILDDIRRLGHSAPDNLDPLEWDIFLNSLGILVYLQKNAAGKL